MLLGLFANELGLWSHKISNTFSASVLVEVVAAQDTRNDMPPKLKNHKINGKVHDSLRLFYIILPCWKLERYTSQGGVFYIL